MRNVEQLQNIKVQLTTKETFFLMVFLNLENIFDSEDFKDKKKNFQKHGNPDDVIIHEYLKDIYYILCTKYLSFI